MTVLVLDTSQAPAVSPLAAAESCFIADTAGDTLLLTAVPGSQGPQAGVIEFDISQAAAPVWQTIHPAAKLPEPIREMLATDARFRPFAGSGG